MNETPENMPYAEIVTLQTNDPVEFERLARTINTDEDVADTRKKGRPPKKLAGKIICALNIKNPHQYDHEPLRRRSRYGDACATAYGSFVLARDKAIHKITEDDYDNNTTEILECAARLVSKVRYDLTHPAVADAASVLRTPSYSRLKERKLSGIWERIQERIENKGSDNEMTHIVYLTPEEYAAQQHPAHEGTSPRSALAEIGQEVPHSELALPLENRATSTPDWEEARSLAIHAARILAALANNRDDQGQRRFSDEEISAWTKPDGMIPEVTKEPLKIVASPVTGKAQEIETKLNNAGSIAIQPSVLSVPAGPDCPPATSGQEISLKRWRNAEQRVCDLLRKLAWQAQDVSQQKLGYDIVGRPPDGEETFIDVKSIEKPGEPFTLTSHEMAVAGEKGLSYQVAVVRQTQSHLEVGFISDPAHQLNLTRQCRQWVWECATYEFKPERYPLS